MPRRVALVQWGNSPLLWVLPLAQLVQRDNTARPPQELQLVQAVQWELTPLLVHHFAHRVRVAKLLWPDHRIAISPLLPLHLYSLN